MNSMENEKQIGLVKWFHDKSKDSNNGFIQHIQLGDLYFNENSIEIRQDIHSKILEGHLFLLKMFLPSLLQLELHFPYLQNLDLLL